MTGSGQPKKETVRIHLPEPPVAKASQPNLKPHETVRIQLPVRETGTPPVPSASSSARDNSSATNLSPPPKQRAVSQLQAHSVRPAPAPATSGPKKETVRIPL